MPGRFLKTLSFRHSQIEIHLVSIQLFEAWFNNKKKVGDLERQKQLSLERNPSTGMVLELFGPTASPENHCLQISVSFILLRRLFQS